MGIERLRIHSQAPALWVPPIRSGSAASAAAIFCRRLAGVAFTML